MPNSSATGHFLGSRTAGLHSSLHLGKHKVLRTGGSHALQGVPAWPRSVGWFCSRGCAVGTLPLRTAPDEAPCCSDLRHAAIVVKLFV